MVYKTLQRRHQLRREEDNCAAVGSTIVGWSWHCLEQNIVSFKGAPDQESWAHGWGEMVIKTLEEPRAGRPDQSGQARKA